MTETANNTNETTTMDHQPRVRQCVFVLSTFFSSSFVFFRVRECFPACCISGGRSNFSFSLFLFRWLHRFGLQKYSETLRKLTNEQFLELKLHPDFAKHEIFDTADKQKLQKAISCLRKERAKFSSSQISTGCVLGSSPSPRRSEGGSSILSSSSSSSSYIYVYIVCQGSSALAKYSVQSRHNTQAKIKMKKFASRALFSHS